MAIYHYSISKLSRAKGRSSVQKMSYITCGMAQDESTGRTFNYLKKYTELVHTETSLPANAKKEWVDPTVLWNEVEKSEKKINSKVAYDMDGALPNELSHAQMIELVRNHVSYLTNKGFCVTWAIHDKEDGNPHVHILTTTRPLDKNGNFTTKEKKVPVLDANGNKVPLIDPKTGEQKIRKRKRIGNNGKEYYSEEKLWQTKKEIYNPLDGRELYKEIRQSWADRCNEYLPEEDKVSPLSFKEQGINQTPSIHIGAVAKEMDQRDVYSWKMENYIERTEVIEEEKKNRLNEMLSKLFEQAEKKVQEIAQKIETKINKLGDYVQNFLKKKEEEKEQNEYLPMYKLFLNHEKKKKSFAEQNFQNYAQYKEDYINLTDTIDSNEYEIKSLISENTDLKVEVERLRRKKVARDAVREPLAEFKKHFEIYNHKIGEVREEEKKLLKNKKKIKQLYAEADEERDAFNKAGDAIYHHIGKVGVRMPAEKDAEAAEKLLNEVDPASQIAEIKDSISKNENRIKQLNTIQENKKDELEEVTRAIECISTYMDVPEEIEDDEYEEIAKDLYDHIEGDKKNGYIVYFKDEDATNYQYGCLTLAKAQVRHNLAFKELKQGLGEYCVKRYEEREYLYEQCPNANDLKVVCEYGTYSIIGKDEDGYTQEINDPQERDVKIFSYKEDAIEYRDLIKEKINSYKEEKGIEIEEERSYDYNIGMHM